MARGISEAEMHVSYSIQSMLLKALFADAIANTTTAFIYNVSNICNKLFVFLRGVQSAYVCLLRISFVGLWCNTIY
ncbi:hypothetical protein LC593_31795 [Nostoc sp. CHAB 5844]|nr:hypothetical protein [Nostoc sp. CHAB 5844]